MKELFASQLLKNSKIGRITGFSLFAMILLSFNLWSQSDDKSSINADPMKIGLLISYDENVSSNVFQFNEFAGYLSNYDKENYSIGVLYEWEFKPDFSFNTAILYSNKDFTGTFYCDTCTFIMPPQPETISWRFLEIPLSLRYYFINESFQFFLDLGLVNQFNIEKGVALKGILDGESYANDYILSGKTDLGVGYAFDNSWGLQLIGSYQRNLSSVVSTGSADLQFIAARLGITKQFR